MRLQWLEKLQETVRRFGTGIYREKTSTGREAV
jgi:hypothetical protein